MADYRHEAVFYEGAEGFLAAMVPFLRDAVARGEPALVAVPTNRLDALRSQIGDNTPGIEFADMEAIGRNPACIIGVWHDFVMSHHGHSRLRGIGEPIYPQRSGAEVDECHRHEALLDLAFSPQTPLWLRCPYDTSQLDGHVIDVARSTHQVIDGDQIGTTESSVPAHIPAHIGDTAFGGASPTPPWDAARYVFDESQTATMRHRGCDDARRLGLSHAQTHELALVISELVTNAIIHGEGTGVLHVWRQQQAIVCQVWNRGTIEQPLVGRLRPAIDQLGGRGLWVTNQLCDLVQVRSHHGETIVTAHLHVNDQLARNRD